MSGKSEIKRYNKEGGEKKKDKVKKKDKEEGAVGKKHKTYGIN